MAIQGFGNTSLKDNEYQGITFENYEHKIKFFGLPLFTITKKHTVDTQSKGKPTNNQ